MNLSNNRSDHSTDSRPNPKPRKDPDTGKKPDAGKTIGSRSKPKRWRPQFKFRLMDLIWLALLVALGIKWQQDHQELRALKDRIAGNVPQPSWSVDQVCGPPNTFAAGDIATAWASKQQDGQREWIIAEFTKSVEIKKIVVHETFNPGAIDKIATVSARNTETVIWQGTDPTAQSAASGKSSFPIKAGINSRRIKIEIDSKAVPGWNEIDAIALHGKDGSIQWASKAWASSSFGANNERPTWFWP